MMMLGIKMRVDRLSMPRQAGFALGLAHSKVGALTRAEGSVLLITSAREKQLRPRVWWKWAEIYARLKNKLLERIAVPFYEY
jgi:hypothetical protein